MSSSGLYLEWSSPDATAQAAKALGPFLRMGDVILLSGNVGAGKTHFARALIQSILPIPEDVPSPTFTLVQVYETFHGPLWHTDLYRVSVDTEIDELGLVDAFDEAICLVEWPDRLGPVAPQNALSLTMTTLGDTRQAKFSWDDARWADAIKRVTTNV